MSTVSAYPRLVNGNAPERKYVGQILVEMGKLPEADLPPAVERAKARKMRVGELLVEEKRISETDLARALATQHDAAFLELHGFIPDPSIVGMLPEKIVKRFLILPLSLKDNRLNLAVYNPMDTDMLDLVGRLLKMPVTLSISPRQQLLEAIEKAYQSGDSVQKIVEALHRKEASTSKEHAHVELATAATAGQANLHSIEALVNRFLEQGVNEQASDIHIDPAENSCRVRMRLDGVLHEMHRYPLDLHNQVISRIKVLSGLDISERRNAQDGRFQYRTANLEIDVRISTLPTIRGEKAVLRLLNKRRQNLSLPELGMDESLVEMVTGLVKRPYGIVFVTGPTGSGKTTTLYSMLNLINSVERNIITVEDPVEFTFDIIHQVQINEKAGVSFAGILKNILRQDPDVMMIGEVRDGETADIAVRASLTGHLVLSTLHTNDAVGSISRLVDMKIEPFLLSSALLGVIAQRLVRRLCKACRTPHLLTEKDRVTLSIPEAKFESIKATPIFNAVGCQECNQSGYRGRVPLFEVMKVDAFIKKAISEKISEVEIHSYMKKNGAKTLPEDGLEKIMAGITSVDEVAKVTT
jgi:type IV pilus assembly protein PilB